MARPLFWMQGSRESAGICKWANWDSRGMTSLKLDEHRICCRVGAFLSLKPCLSVVPFFPLILKHKAFICSKSHLTKATWSSSSSMGIPMSIPEAACLMQLSNLYAEQVLYISHSAIGLLTSILRSETRHVVCHPWFLSIMMSKSGAWPQLRQGYTKNWTSPLMTRDIKSNEDILVYVMYNWYIASKKRSRAVYLCILYISGTTITIFKSLRR